MENRKATDVILDLEAKVDALLSIIRAQDLNIKLISNKLNSILVLLENTKAPQYAMEAPKSNDIKISSENNILTDNAPKGFKRGSRTENLPEPPKQIKITQDKPQEIIVPNKPEQAKQEEQIHNINKIPVIQRVVDGKGSSIFLADVEIFQLDTGKSISKTRTNGTGKWMASLLTGDYKVIINKRDAMTKEKVKTEQIIRIDGNSSTVELKTLIIK